MSIPNCETLYHGLCGPTERTGLLQGLVVSGRCSDRMTVGHTVSRSHPTPHYAGQRRSIQRTKPACQRPPSAAIDPAVEKLVLKTLTPASIVVAVSRYSTSCGTEPPRLIAESGRRSAGRESPATAGRRRNSATEVIDVLTDLFSLPSIPTTPTSTASRRSRLGPPRQWVATAGPDGAHRAGFAVRERPHRKLQRLFRDHLLNGDIFYGVNDDQSLFYRLPPRLQRWRPPLQSRFRYRPSVCIATIPPLRFHPGPRLRGQAVYAPTFKLDRSGVLVTVRPTPSTHLGDDVQPPEVPPRDNHQPQ